MVLPPFTVTEATLADLESTLVTNNAAFHDNSFRQTLFPQHLAHLTAPDELKAWRINYFTKTYGEKNAKCFKAVQHGPDAIEQVVGFSVWYPPGPGGDGDSTKESHENDSQDGNSYATSAVIPMSESLIRPEDDLPACIDSEFLKSHVSDLAIMKKEIWGDDANFWYLASLAVHPDHQRKGIASVLLKRGFEAADHDGLPLYLEAAPAGKPLYDSMGFRKVSELIVPVLNGGSYLVTGMKRDPVSQKGC